MIRSEYSGYNPLSANIDDPYWSGSGNELNFRMRNVWAIVDFSSVAQEGGRLR